MMLESGIETARAMLVATYLKQLKMPAMARSYAQIAREARQAEKPYEEFLLALLQQEVAQREVSRQKPIVCLKGGRTESGATIVRPWPFCPKSM